MKRVVLSLFLWVLLLWSPSFAQEEEKWKGFDEKVIEKLAEERGREPRSLFVLEGDLELSAFALFSGISGFIVGYYWRKLFSEKEDVSQLRKETITPLRKG
uniref:Cobalt ABC transporter permease n=1 Tax=Caldimicrobium thiodismutans TaxID=1653476 RepID=A0A832GMJ7_9BACT